MDKKIIIFLIVLIAILGVIMILKITGFIGTSIKIQEATEESGEKIMKKTSNMAQTMFNMTFEEYKGSDISLATVKQLKQTVEVNNKNYLERQVELVLDETSGKDRYNVEIKYSDEGYVNKIIVTGK